MSNTDISTFYEDLPNNLPDNSTKAREDRKQKVAREGQQRAEKVVRGKVKTESNKVRKWTDIFFSEDTANVGNYILMDVLVPSIKKAIYDIVVNSLDMSLFGGRGGKRSTGDKISYRDYSGISRRDRDERSYRSYSSSDRGYQDIIFETRADAKDVLDSMDEIMETYDRVRVADMFDLAGLTCEHTLNNYGWTDIRSAKIVPAADGYKIKMPRALPLH